MFVFTFSYREEGSTAFVSGAGNMSGIPAVKELQERQGYKRLRGRRLGRKLGIYTTLGSGRRPSPLPSQRWHIHHDQKMDILTTLRSHTLCTCPKHL